ncbi:MAG: hypothetical protein ACXVZ2_03825 [Gaiellaceae bacterium]
MIRGALLALAVVVLVAGCGGGGGGSSSSTTSAADWASAYCSDAATWVSALQSARDNLKNNSRSTDAQEAVQSVSLATNTFTIAMGRVGQPDTPNGAADQQAASELGKNVQGRVARASTAVQSNNPSVPPAQQAAVARKQATASIAAISSTTTQLEQSDPQLGAAMKTSSECSTLKADLAKTG